MSQTKLILIICAVITIFLFGLIFAMPAEAKGLPSVTLSMDIRTDCRYDGDLDIGGCITNNYQTIVINAKQDLFGIIFSLLHEFGHWYLDAGRINGVSDEEISKEIGADIKFYCETTGKYLNINCQRNQREAMNDMFAWWIKDRETVSPKVGEFFIRKIQG